MKKTKAVLLVMMLLCITAQVWAEQVLFKLSDFSADTLRDDYTGTIGLKFVVGSEDALVDMLGFIDLGADGLAQNYLLRIWDDAANVVVAEATVPAGTASLKQDGFRYVPVNGGFKVLKAAKTYVFSAEVTSGGGDQWYNDNVAVQPNTYFVGSNASSTWSNTWGAAGAKPTGYWHSGTSYGFANIIARPLQHAHDPEVINNGPSGSSASVTLKWKTALDATETVVNPDVTKHYLYIANDEPNLVNVTPITVTAGSAQAEYTLNVAYDTQKYWKVKESILNSAPTDGNSIDGPVWTFVISALPQITQQPTAVRELAGTSVQLSVQFTSISPAVVTWKKYVDGVNDTTVATDTEFDVGPGGVLISELQFTPLAATDDGRYYCLIANDDTGSTPVQSDTVTVIANRLLVQYDLDGTLAPASGSAADAPTGQGKSIDGLTEPNSLQASDITLTPAVGIDGVAGHAIQIDPNQYVDFGTAGYPKAGSLPGGIGLGFDEGSILCWVKSTKSADQALYADYNSGTNTGFVLSLTPSGSTANGRINVRGETNQNINTLAAKPDRPDWNMLDGAWHMVIATWKAGGTMILYVDGQQVASGAAGTPAAYLPWQRGLLMGATRTAANRDMLMWLFSGAMDNLRVYNYQQDADAIAQEYYAATGIKPCTNAAFAGSIYNYDNTGASYCIVDIADFVVFASQWLKEGLYP